MRHLLYGLLFLAAPLLGFNYDLHLTTLPGNSTTMICCHGMGGNYQIGAMLKEGAKLPYTIVSFNFPDASINPRQFNAEKSSFGTPEDLFPAFYVLKKTIIDKGKRDIILYGFSAGGGVIVNLLAALQETTYDTQLANLGIHQKEKKELLEVLQKGKIVLDVPLKSIREIIDFRGASPDMLIIEKHYRENHMEPIDTLLRLKDLSMNVLVFFQNPDEILSNRDDGLYVERLEKANVDGTTEVLSANDGCHACLHLTLWKALLSS